MTKRLNRAIRGFRGYGSGKWFTIELAEHEFDEASNAYDGGQIGGCAFPFCRLPAHRHPAHGTHKCEPHWIRRQRCSICWKRMWKFNRQTRQNNPE